MNRQDAKNAKTSPKIRIELSFRSSLCGLPGLRGSNSLPISFSSSFIIPNSGEVLETPRLFDIYTKSIYDEYMKTISVNVAEPAYEELKALASRDGRPVAELLRQSMVEFIEKRRRDAPSVFSLAPHDSGPMLFEWSRAEFFDEARER